MPSGKKSQHMVSDTFIKTTKLYWHLVNTETKTVTVKNDTVQNLHLSGLFKQTARQHFIFSSRLTTNLQ